MDQLDVNHHTGLVQCHPTFPSFNCLKWGCRSTIRATWPKQRPDRNQPSVQNHEKHKKRSGSKKTMTYWKKHFFWNSRKKTYIGRHRYIYIYSHSFRSFRLNTLWLYGGYLKKGHPVGLENEVTNAYLQNMVNWPIPACKSGEAADVDETGPLDLQTQRATDSQSTESTALLFRWLRPGFEPYHYNCLPFHCSNACFGMFPNVKSCKIYISMVPTAKSAVFAA